MNFSINRKIKTLYYNSFLIFILVIASSKIIVNAQTLSPEKDEIKSIIEKIYGIRSNAFVTNDASPLKDYYDTKQKYGKWSLEHEIKRVQYLNNWADQRGIEIINVESSIRIKKINSKGQIIRIPLEESYKFDYRYPSDSEQKINSFGIGIRHSLSLIKKNDQWLVYSDWYTDCFEDALANYNGTLPACLMFSQNTVSQNSYSNFKRYYDREKAVNYADKYCGAAWGSGNNYKYNSKYRDFNGIGGDCTNFVSQVLGDKEAGGLPFGGGWHCVYAKYGNSQGSAAWVNADGLKNYLIYSGKGSIIKKGTFKQLTEQTEKSPLGAIGKLKLGDLICYEKGAGNIDHFAVVTGFDSHGYPLVNSHTTDRYHVPWDLGWGDNRIRFLLIHING